MAPFLVSCSIGDLWFPFVLGPLIGYYAWRRDKFFSPVTHSSYWVWAALLILAVLSHPLLDLFTSYGTQLFAPFSRHRYAIDAIAIIDPIYTGILCLSLAIGWWASNPKRRSAKLAVISGFIGLVLSSSYIFYGYALNEQAQSYALEQFKREQVEEFQVHAYPTLLQLFLRRLVARTEDKVCVGSVSMWHPKPIVWSCSAIPHDSRIEQLKSTREGKIFEWFAMGQTMPRIISSPQQSIIQIADMRYGFLNVPDQGLWGIEAKFDQSGQLEGTVSYYSSAVRWYVTLDRIKSILAKAFKGSK